MYARDVDRTRRLGRRILCLAGPALLVATLAASACAQWAGRAGGEAVGHSIEAMTEAENLENLETAMTSPEVSRSVQGLSEAAAAGIVTGLTGPEASRAMAGMMRQSADAMRGDLGPALANVVRSTVDEAMASFLSEAHHADMSAMASRVGGAMTASMMRELGAGLEEEVVPAMVRAFESEVAPAVVRALQDPELRNVAAMHARDLAYNTVIGTNQGIADVATGDPVVGAGDLGLFGRRLTLGWAALVAMMAGLGIALVVMVVLLLKGASQRRHLEEDSRRREAMFMTLVETTLLHDATPGERREMLDRLRAGTRVDLGETVEGETPAADEERPRGWWRRRFA